jgi:hypothetical protein
MDYNGIITLQNALDEEERMLPSDLPPSFVEDTLNQFVKFFRALA